ncbi:MAG: glycosyltransferase family 9 protein [Bacteroidetes bacterium]|nr:glycosyltransferase family 9 protein [Bacteroidota bacterium]
MIVHGDCKFFKGDIPCKPHKEFGYHCEGCPVYKKISNNILIIKLGAIGDVIRTTPLLRKLRKEFPDAYISWLTYSPDIISKSWVDRILNVTTENIELIKNIEFDWLINLDKDGIAVSLANSIKAKKKSGFTIDEFGHAKPFGKSPEDHKWITGLFDDLNKQNTKHYVQEIFEICGYDFKNEEYILEVEPSGNKWNIDKTKKVIGLNTGCGGRWTSRLWPTEYWIKLAKELLSNGYEVILLGGEQEDEKNKYIQKESGAKYFGFYPLKIFMDLLNQCDAIVSAVTMAMHLAIGLNKKLILFNNIFNKHEFYLYGKGEILEPDFDCDCYFTPVCSNNCMQYLYPEIVFNSIKRLE